MILGSNVNFHQDCALLRIQKNCMFSTYNGTTFGPRYSSSTHQGMESCYGLWQGHGTYRLSKVIRWGWMVGWLEFGVKLWLLVGILLVGTQGVLLHRICEDFRLGGGCGRGYVLHAFKRLKLNDFHSHAKRKDPDNALLHPISLCPPLRIRIYPLQYVPP